MNRKIGVILSYVMMLFEVFSTLLLTPFIIRTLGQAEFGVYKLSAAVTAYLLLLDLGVGNAIIRYIAKFRSECNREKEQQFLGIAVIFYAIIGILALAVGFLLVRLFPSFFSNGLNPEEIALGQKLLLVTMVNCAVTLATSCFQNVILAYEKFALSRISSILQIIAKIIGTYVVLKLGFGSVGIVSVQLILTVALRLFLMGYVLFKMKLYPHFKNIEFGFVREVVSYSALIFVQMIATQLNSSIDQILLGRMVSASAIIIGIYGVGSQIVQYYQQIGCAFTNVLMPGIVKLVSNDASAGQITDEMVRIGRIILIVLGVIWACFLVNGKNFILLWAGEENTAAYYVAIILMFAYMFILSESVGTQVLWALNEHKEQSFLKIAIVFLNIILTIFLIKWNPLIGATIGTFISLLLGDVGVMNVIFRKKLGMNLRAYYGKLLKGVAPCILISICSGYIASIFLTNSWLHFFTKVFIMCCVYFITMWVYGFNSYERGLVKSLFRVLKK